MTARPVPFFDRSRGDGEVEQELVDVFRRMVRGGHYILGPEVEAFESECAAYLGARHAIGVSSGTDALLIALLSLGIGPGDEVICPAYTFVATASVVQRVGATPVFADVLPDGLHLDPTSAARAVTPRTRAVIVVHLFGDCAPLGDLLSLTAARDIHVIEDAAQAFGAGRADLRAGSSGVFGCFSFFPTKNLGGFGDGGLVITPRDDLAERARVLRAQGAARKHEATMIGGNFRLDALQAALLRRKLPRLDALIARRRGNARRYDASLRPLGLPVSLPDPNTEGHTFNQYVLRAHDAAQRDALRRFLAEREIGTEIYYPAPLHLQPCFAHLRARAGTLPIAEAAARDSLALPIFPELTEAEVTRVSNAVADFFGMTSAFIASSPWGP